MNDPNQKSHYIQILKIQLLAISGDVSTAQQRAKGLPQGWKKIIDALFNSRQYQKLIAFQLEPGASIEDQAEFCFYKAMALHNLAFRDVKYNKGRMSEEFVKRLQVMLSWADALCKDSIRLSYNHKALSQRAHILGLKAELVLDDETYDDLLDEQSLYFELANAADPDRKLRQKGRCQEWRSDEHWAKGVLADRRRALKRDQRHKPYDRDERRIRKKPGRR
ncbi:hypothetical protein [Parendozoicomonas haliclonae]|uniref:hypothetical protein n=1 Tax=Parendozoicomonas haliclonae TaxID=1960125 RepID=UPI001055CE55|nr:hypothetical protein [Parendozoicomonas haliclonae]